MRNIRLLGVFATLTCVFCAAWIISRARPREYDVSDLARAIELGYDARAAELIRRGLGGQIHRPLYEEERWRRPIHDAAYWGNARILSILLSQDGIGPDDRDFRGYTPLMYLCMGCEVKRAVEYRDAFNELIRHHADVNAASESGETALHLVSFPTFLVELLLAAGADPNRKDNHGNTPLHSVCESLPGFGPGGSSADGIPSLLVAGADPAAVNDAGLTPRQLAEKNQRDKAIAILDRFDKLMKKSSESQAAKGVPGSPPRGHPPRRRRAELTE